MSPVIERIQKLAANIAGQYRDANPDGYAPTVDWIDVRVEDGTAHITVYGPEPGSAPTLIAWLHRTFADYNWGFAEEGIGTYRIGTAPTAYNKIVAGHGLPGPPQQRSAGDIYIDTSTSKMYVQQEIAFADGHREYQWAQIGNA